MRKSSLLIHSSNTVMPGSTQLMSSLLPEMEHASSIDHLTVLLPETGILSSYQKRAHCTSVSHYKRVLPNSLSRVLECLFPAKEWSKNDVILVMGDIPLRIQKPQIVFLQNSNLTKEWRPLESKGSLKYWISTRLLQLNLKYVSKLIVQTEVMRKKVIYSYPEMEGKVEVIPQPVPEWMLSFVRQTDRVYRDIDLQKIKKEGLSFFYPAAGYPHKNHLVLNTLSSVCDGEPSVNKVTLTLNKNDLKLISELSIQYTGPLQPEEMLKHYTTSDALLFLSSEESFGFPLVEAMVMGLPIIAPDLAYARVLCGDEAVYFQENDASSLQEAIKELKGKILSGWKPDYSAKLQNFPKTWAEVAQSFLRVVDEVRI